MLFQQSIILSRESLIISLLFSGSLQGPQEKRLLHHLLDKYNTLERPVAKESDPLQLSFGLTLMQIIDVVSEPIPLSFSLSVYLSVSICIPL